MNAGAPTKRQQDKCPVAPMMREFLRPGWFSVVQRVPPAVQQHSEFPRLVLPDGLSSLRWMIHLQGLRRPLRRSSAVFCLTAAARRLRRTTSTTGRPVPLPSRPSPTQRRPPCPNRHAEARSTHSGENLQRTRQRAAQRLWRRNWGTLAEFSKASAATCAGPVTGSETPQAPTNGAVGRHRRRGGRSSCGSPAPRIPAPQRPREAPAPSAGISTIRQSNGLSMAPVRFPDNPRRKTNPCLSASTECAAHACPATAGSVTGRRSRDDCQRG